MGVNLHFAVHYGVFVSEDKVIEWDYESPNNNLDLICTDPIDGNGEWLLGKLVFDYSDNDIWNGDIPSNIIPIDLFNIPRIKVALNRLGVLNSNPIFRAIIYGG